MLTLLMKRQARRCAQNAAPTQKEEGSPSGTSRPSFDSKPWNEIQNTLKTDLTYLRGLSGSQEKTPFKEELVKKYASIVEGLLETHNESLAGLDVVWWWYQWRLDTESLVDVHDAFRRAIERGVETPSNWKSNAQTAYCDIIFKYSHEHDAKKAEFNPQYLIQAVSDVSAGTLAINAPLKVKMFRLVGDWHLAKGEKEEAFKLFDIVMTIDPGKGGRKNKLTELKEALGYE